MESEIVKQGLTLFKAGVFSQFVDDQVVACDVRTGEWITIAIRDAQYAEFDELEDYYEQVPHPPGEDEQSIAYRAAEVRATWGEAMDLRRQRADYFSGRFFKDGQ